MHILTRVIVSAGVKLMTLFITVNLAGSATLDVMEGRTFNVYAKLCKFRRHVGPDLKNKLSRAALKYDEKYPSLPPHHISLWEPVSSHI